MVVLGASPTGLYALREAAAAGYRVAIADTVTGCAFRSRHIRAANRRFRGRLKELERWLKALASNASEQPVLVPTNDMFLEFIVERYQALVSLFRLPASSAELANQLLDKKRFHELCQENRIATAGVWSVDHARSLPALADKVPFPCLLKPTLIHHAREFLKGRKVLVAKTQEEFVELAESVPEDTGGWLVQEIIPGPESAITLFGGYIDSSGRPRQVFSARKLRQYPPGFGSASLVASQPCAETEARSLAFLDQMGFKGVCGVEFKRDPRDGLLKIIEINARPTLWFQIAHDAGKQIVSAMLADLMGRESPDDRRQDPNVLWRYALKDAYSALFYMRRRHDFVLPGPDVSMAKTMQKRSWPTFSFDDPRPALYEPFGYLRKLWARLG